MFSRQAMAGMVNITGLFGLVSAAPGATCDLFDNDVNPAPDADWATVFHVASFAGYSQVAGMTAWNMFILPGVEENYLSSNTSAVFNTTADIPGGVTIYGYVVRDHAGVPAWYRRFDTPIRLLKNGDAISFIPQVSLKLDSQGAA